MILPETEAVAILVPCLNEERHIEACLESLLPGLEGLDHEILVLDGGSTDRTRAIVAALAAAHPAIRLVENPGRLQSAAMNLGARLAKPAARILVRADAHAVYPPGFVRTCTQALRARNATSVVVPMITIGRRPMQRAIAAAQNSRLGNGGSAHRTGGGSRFVEHGHHAAFDRDFFLRLGGYDERFTHNEDAELDVRAVQAGGRIWMCRESAINYLPRSDLAALARQYRRHGQGRARTTMLHGRVPKPRQLAPVFALTGCVAGLGLAAWHPVFLGIPLLYIVACQAVAGVLAWRARDPALLGAGPAAMVMHLAWAWGFLTGLARAPRRPNPGPDATPCTSFS